MFDLVLTISVGVSLRLGGAVKKYRLCNKEKKKKNFKIQKLIPAGKKVIVVTQLLSAWITSCPNFLDIQNT